MFLLLRNERRKKLFSTRAVNEYIPITQGIPEANLVTLAGCLEAIYEGVPVEMDGYEVGSNFLFYLSPPLSVSLSISSIYLFIKYNVLMSGGGLRERFRWSRRLWAVQEQRAATYGECIIILLLGVYWHLGGVTQQEHWTVVLARPLVGDHALQTVQGHRVANFSKLLL